MIYKEGILSPPKVKPREFMFKVDNNHTIVEVVVSNRLAKESGAYQPLENSRFLARH